MAHDPTRFDIDAFLDEQIQRKRKQGEYDTAAASRKAVAARKRNERARREALWAQREPSRFDRNQRGRKRGITTNAVLDLMDRETWWTSSEVMAELDLPAGSIGSTLDRLRKLGELERRQNPDYDPAEPFYWGAGRHKCKWEYRAAAPTDDEGGGDDGEPDIFG